MSSRGKARNRNRVVQTQITKGTKRKVLHTNYKEVKKQRNIAIALIPILVVSTLIIAIGLMNDLEIILYSNEDLEDYDYVALIIEHNGKEYEIEIEDGEEASIKIPKTSEIKGIKVIQNKTNLIEEYKNTTSISKNFTFEETQYPENLEYVKANTTQENDTQINSSEHYMGCDSFYYDTNTPDNWTHNDKVKISDNVMNHAKVLSMDYSGYVEKMFSPKFYNGTFELWFNLDYYRGFIMTFEQDLCSNNFQIGVMSPTNNANIIHLQHYNGTEWVNNSAIESTRVFDRQWYNLRVDFKCHETNCSYMGLDNGTFTAYLNDKKIFDKANMTNPAIMEVQWVDVIRFDSIKTDTFAPPVVAKAHFDSISWLNGTEEITKEKYELGDKDITFDRYFKKYLINLNFNKDYRNMKNFTFSFEFETNKTLAFDGWNRLAVYNFWNSEFFEIFSPITTNFSLSEEVYYPPIIFFNDSSFDYTNLQAELVLSNLGSDFEVDLNYSVMAYFWKEIESCHFEQSETLEFESIIEIKNELEIEENKYIFTSVVYLSEVIGFGSWIFTNTESFNTTIIIEEEIHTFKQDQIENLVWESFFGLRLLDIEIKRIDLEDHYADIDYIFGGIVF